MLINGEPADSVSALDRGLMYGDGLFSTVAVRAGRAELWGYHLERLAEGCARLGLAYPGDALLTAERERVLAGVGMGVLRLTLTRGVAGRGYRPPAAAEATRILSVHPWPDHSGVPASGVALRLCALRLAIQPALAGLKSLNRLEQVLARAEWDEPALPEGLMLDAEGRVVEGTMSNVFWAEGGRLHTPRLSRCGVAGVMRRRLCELARADGIEVVEGDYVLDEVLNADEVFLCNSLIRIWPVASLCNSSYPWGALTRRLQALLSLSLR